MFHFRVFIVFCNYATFVIGWVRFPKWSWTWTQRLVSFNWEGNKSRKCLNLWEEKRLSPTTRRRSSEWCRTWRSCGCSKRYVIVCNRVAVIVPYVTCFFNHLLFTSRLFVTFAFLSAGERFGGRGPERIVTLLSVCRHRSFGPHLASGLGQGNRPRKEICRHHPFCR